MNTTPPSETINHLQTALFAERKLRPVFSDVTLQGQKAATPDKRVWDARYLEIANLVADKPSEPDKAFAKDKIELEYCKDSEYTLFHLSQKYGCRIPSQDANDVSFFDDLRIQKAKEACGACEKYLLIKGDLSGIQDFIYGDIPIENPGGISDLAKKLRGKSFFIAVITDFLAEIVLERLHLPYWNLLFAGGGHFNLLAPWSEENEKRLSSITRELNLHLREETNSRLCLVLASVQCEGDIFENAAGYMERVNAKRDELKYSQHSGYLDEIFFEKPSDHEEPDWEKIGELIPKTEHLLEVSSRKKLPAKTDSGNLIKLYEYRFANSDKFLNIYAVKGSEETIEEAADNMSFFLKTKASDITEVKVITLNSFNFLEIAGFFGEFKDKIDIHFGFRLVGKEAPKYKGNLLDFEEIARLQKGCPPDPSKSEQSPIYPQLAVVRLDVDDLGCLFAHGLRDKADLRHFAALSRELNLFFSGHFNQLAKKYGMYVVYSGGDDAFAVGNWCSTLHFVEQLCNDFKSYTGDNPDLHFSAGIFMCDEHFPVAKFADEAGDLEKAAKDFNRKEKNRIHVFNHILPTGNFVSTLDFGQKILKYTAAEDRAKEERLSKGLVNRLLNLIRQSFYDRTEIVEGEVRKRGKMDVNRFYRGGRNLHYLFARNGFTKEKTDKAANELTKDIIKHFIDNWREEELSVLKDATVALHYVLYRKRKPKNN